jgi:hypothetical protein
MKIFRESYDKKKRDWDRDPIQKVSEAEKGDSIYLQKSQAEDAEFFEKINAILSQKSLVVVTKKARQFESGDIKFFIGELNYQAFETELA